MLSSMVVPNVVNNYCALSLFDTVVNGIRVNLLLRATKRNTQLVTTNDDLDDIQSDAVIARLDQISAK